MSGGRRFAARAGDLALRVAGGAVALAGGLLVGLLVLLWTPWRVDTWFGLVRMPAAVVVAIAGPLLLMWFAPRATGSRWGVVLPAAGWFTMAVAALSTTREGGYLLVLNDWVAMLALFSGTLVVVIGTLLALLPARPR